MIDTQPVRILLADSDENAAEALVSAFRNAAIPVRAQFVASESALNTELQRLCWDMLLIRRGAPVGDLAHVVCLARSYHASLPILMLETDSDPSRLTDALRVGAVDAILPGEDERLLLVVRRELGHARERARLQRAEHIVHEVEHRADLLLGEIDAGVAYVQDGMHVAANRKYLDMFGYASSDELLGATMIDLVPAHHQDDLKQHLRAIADGTTDPFDMQGQHRDGESFAARMTVLSASYEGEPCWQVLLRKCPTNIAAELPLDISTIPSTILSTMAATVGPLPVATPPTHHADANTLLAAVQEFFAEVASNAVEASLASVIIANHPQLRAQAGLTTLWRLTSAVAELLAEALPPPHRILQVADDAFVLLLYGPNALSAREEIALLAGEISERCARDSAGTLTLEITTVTAELPDETPTDLGVFTRVLTCQNAAAAVPIPDPNRATSTPGPASQPAAAERNGQASPRETVATNDIGVAPLLAAAALSVAMTAPAFTTPPSAQIIARIEQCLTDSTFVLLFQPIISVRGDSDEHYEVFVRMPLSAGGSTMLAADEFLSAALHANLGGRIDRWVILQAIKLLSVHRANGHDTRLTINLCSVSMLDENFLPWLGTAIRAARLPSDALVFQVTEADALATPQQSRSFMRGMQDLHCRMSVSRFTGGGNPTQFLRHLSVDFVKLDPSLIDAVQAHPQRREDLGKLIALLQSQGRLTIVPMVENAKLLAALWQAGANYIQGHYLQEPSTEMDFDFTGDE